MVEPSIPVSEIKKMIKKIVVASLEKFIRFDKGKEKVVVKDDEEAKDESKKKEHVDELGKSFLRCLPRRSTVNGNFENVPNVLN
ncbi:hypothetical protein JCGZ_04919 [Jatropha curcas]|uniref:Uncharacterized protein n=1 Tax=Jatropha curcas TaxID=180498 RepID=A0A067L5P7_JATCU|nr:hypothetical protein JCGZ_04919 [Jatropha curcas]